MKSFNNFIEEKLKVTSKDKISDNEQNIPYDIISDGIYNIESTIESLVDIFHNDDEALESFITEVLGNVTQYELFDALEKYFKK